MTDDPTLTDFVGEDPDEPETDDSGGSAGDTAAETNPDSTTTEATTDSSERDTNRPESGDGEFDTGLSTYGWGEYTCSRCGAGADRVWRDDGALVCPDCKSW